jgi:O-methyltransferase
MVSKERLMNLACQCQKFRDTGFSFVECGVAKGGCLALMKSISNTNTIFGFDSFENMPPITQEDIGEYNKSNILTDFGNLSGGIENVYNTFRTLQLNMENVHLVKGFFNSTLTPSIINEIGPIAILRLDSDWYESTKICLDRLYDNVIDDGVIIIDDYGHWVGAKKATDEFRLARGITSPLQSSDYTERYWIKNS